MAKFDRTILAALALGLITLCGCQELGTARHRKASLAPRFQRSEIIGFLAGLGNYLCRCAGFDSNGSNVAQAQGINPRMAEIIGAFQILWVYYGLLIASRPVIAWNVIAVLINFLCVGAYAYFVRARKSSQMMGYIIPGLSGSAPPSMVQADHQGTGPRATAADQSLLNHRRFTVFADQGVQRDSRLSPAIFAASGQTYPSRRRVAKGAEPRLSVVVLPP